MFYTQSNRKETESHAKKNGFTKELMHKQITETIVTSSPSEVKRLEQTERLRSESAKGNKSALRIWANRAWYDKHKAWKKAYNAKYYQDNKDYWQNYYKFAHDNAKARKRMAAETEQEAKAAKNKFGEDSKEYQRARDRAITNAEWAREDEAEFKVAKMNLERAFADAKWYEGNMKRMNITDAWLDGSKQIRSAGKKTLSKLTKSLNIPASKLSGFAKGVKGFFQK